ncbi:hypothetical protein MHB50_04290 [Siminovitchia sp. FSL H7-0308]|uniref:Uncharacterized protein n=1 Tax=Siminovitchia thermophila TaxID=1245522 RepID=A0ABS2R763_9BACI|nr:hypothetical protein [Siminovitchia thermophila]MBM7715245.1 hypothetical protein [Siminovitchia thermophila]
MTRIDLNVKDKCRAVGLAEKEHNKQIQAIERIYVKFTISYIFLQKKDHEK